MTSIAYGRGGNAGDGVVRSAARGGILIGVAVVIGIILLQVVDDAGTGPGASQGSSSGASRTTTSQASTVRPTQEVTVAVFNASNVTGAATKTSNTLRGLGYMIGKVGNTTEQVGTTIACREGYEEEAQALAALPELAGATVVALPATPPPETENANCIVTLGT